MVSRNEYMQILTKILVELTKLYDDLTKSDQKKIHELTKLFVEKKKNHIYTELSEDRWDKYISHIIIFIEEIIHNLLKKNHFYSQKDIVKQYDKLSTEDNSYTKIKNYYIILQLIPQKK